MFPLPKEDIMGQLVLATELAQARIHRAQALMQEQKIDFMLLPVSPELEWLVGYQTHALERLTVLVVRQNGFPDLVVPELEVVTLQVPAELFRIHQWSQGQDPFKMTVELAVGYEEPADDGFYNIAVGRKMPSMHLLPLQKLLQKSDWQDTEKILSPMRRTKDAGEIADLREIARVVDLTIAEIQAGKIPLLGRTERAVADDVTKSMLRNGHASVTFCIVATGSNSADPHHEPDDTVIERGHVVLFDIGGRSKKGYSSDITRCVTIGEPKLGVPTTYNFLRTAQELAFKAAKPGVRACDVDAAARNSLAEVKLEQFFVHSTGHGIGLDEHEDPFVNKINQAPLLVGDAFSIEPGVYFAGSYGLRLEDIVIMTEDGAVRLNNTCRDLIELDQ
ncbi:MAG: Peptidase M24 [Parcubacteria group bacterium GW2011_GWC2_39_14]|nr:MAG: Peptidase M24 [Parcubacteria group bacterium GW2011_GWC2_39_14]KKR54413.1 MAG: Peptidase M24 [Parcubacteria group bacterium GW2011_GWA2_40_23]